MLAAKVFNLPPRQRSMSDKPLTKREAAGARLARAPTTLSVTPLKYTKVRPFIRLLIARLRRCALTWRRRRPLDRCDLRVGAFEMVQCKGVLVRGGACRRSSLTLVQLFGICAL